LYKSWIRIDPPVEKFPSEHKEYEATWNEMIPLKRFAKPTDIIGAAIFLALSASDYITGRNIIIDGGYTISNSMKKLRRC